MFTH